VEGGLDGFKASSQNFPWGGGGGQIKAEDPTGRLVYLSKELKPNTSRT